MPEVPTAAPGPLRPCRPHARPTGPARCVADYPANPSNPLSPILSYLVHRLSSKISCKLLNVQDFQPVQDIFLQSYRPLPLPRTPMHSPPACARGITLDDLEILDIQWLTAVNFPADPAMPGQSPIIVPFAGRDAPKRTERRPCQVQPWEYIFPRPSLRACLLLSHPPFL